MGKPDTNQYFDQCIREALRSKAGELAPSDVLLGRINSEINRKEREYYKMNHRMNFRKMKPVVIAAVVLILSAATCFAATKIAYLTSTSQDAFNTFPTERQVEKAVNFSPDYVKEFTNGFTFKSASVSNNAAVGEDNSKVAENKGISFFYTKDGAVKDQMLTLSADPQMEGLTDEPTVNEEVIQAGGYDLTYSKVTFKVVPVGYVPSDEENQQVAQGTLWISEGSDQVQVSDVQYAEWVKDGIVYNLMDNGYGLDKTDFVKMAGEVIAAE